MLCGENLLKMKIEWEYFVEIYEELSTLLENPIYENIHFNYFDHNIIRVAARKTVSHITYESNAVIIACSVTCYARLKLYDALISLPRDSVLYCDTDSIYYSENGEELIEYGSFVGQLKDELSHGEYIMKFCSTRPKCYSYLTNKDREIVHVKGFQLSNVNFKKLLTHQFMNVVNDSDIFVDVEESQIVKNDKLCIFTRKDLVTCLINELFVMISLVFPLVMWNAFCLFHRKHST